MMSKSHIVEFSRLATIPEPTPAKATLRADVRVSVQRSINKLPMLGHRNPDAALLIERSIDDYMPAADDDGGQHQADWSRTTEAERLRLRQQIQADFQALVMDQVLDQCSKRWRERQRSRSEQTIQMLQDQAGDLSAAS